MVYFLFVCLLKLILYNSKPQNPICDWKKMFLFCFAKILNQAFLHDSNIWLWSFFTFLVDLAHTVAHSPHLHYHLCFLLKLHNVFNTFVWCVKKLSIVDCKKLPVISVSFCLRWHELSPFFKRDLVFLSIKVDIGHKILRNLHHTFDWHYIGQKLRFRKILSASQNIWTLSWILSLDEYWNWHSF